MATVNVKFRKSTVTGKPGTIYYQIYHNKSSRQLTTSIHIYPHEWDESTQSILLAHDSQNILQGYVRQIEEGRRTLNAIISKYERQGQNYTSTDVVDTYRTQGGPLTLMNYMRRHIQWLESHRRYGTAKNYQCALRSMAAFLGHRDIPLTAFNDDLVLRYNDWLCERDIVKNSISFYMRIWRALYNKGVKEGIIRQTYPFRNVYTGVDHTRKRAVDECTIVRLLELDLVKSPILDFSRDLFVFSYCTRGMAFVDLAFLKKKNIQNNVLTYNRRKTNQQLSMRVEPCMAQIIKKYERATRNTDFVFPILTAKTEEERYRQYHSTLGYYNRKLKDIARMAGIEISLSSYTSRHTWATSARNHNIPISVISAGMGHTSEKTTEIYLASLENSVIDEANSQLLRPLNRIITL